MIEDLECIRCVVEAAQGRVPVIAGTGSNNTAHAVMMSKEAAARGADALLLVTPYYNKTSQAGLVKSFFTIADSTDLPAIIYNVPSRTGVNIQPETALELSRHPMIRGLKEASGNIAQVVRIAALCGEELPLYSGNDDQVVPLLSVGGKGVISVAANVAPAQMHQMCQLWFDGKIKESAAMQLELNELCSALFCDVNPIPVKAAMNMLGWDAGDCRLPLVEPTKQIWSESKKHCGILVCFDSDQAYYNFITFLPGGWPQKQRRKLFAAPAIPPGIFTKGARKMTDIIIQGINGRMGKVLCELIAQRDDCRIVGGVDVSAQSGPIPVAASLEELNVKADVIIDFSTPEATKSMLRYCQSTSTACVVCTTGLDGECGELIQQTAKKLRFSRAPTCP